MVPVVHAYKSTQTLILERGAATVQKQKTLENLKRDRVKRTSRRRSVEKTLELHLAGVWTKLILKAKQTSERTGVESINKRAKDPSVTSPIVVQPFYNW